MELVEEVDEDGAVLRVVTRAAMRAANLRHRSVGVVVRRPGDRAVLVHRRAGWKDVWPGLWDLAFGGVCTVGEEPVTSAQRELTEEAGVEVGLEALRFLGRDRYEDGAVRVVGFLYETEHGGPFTFADGEVEEVAWVPFLQLGDWLAGTSVVPDSRSMAVPLLGP